MEHTHTMPTENDAADVAVDEAAALAAEDAAFASGFPAKPAEKGKGDKPGQGEPKVEAKVEAKAPPPAAPVVEKPEYVKVTRREWDEVRAASAKTASYDQQLSKLFGSTGKLQATINALQGQTPAGRKVPKAAFEAMAKDFPELADANHKALEAVFESMGMVGTGPAVAAEMDETVFEKLAAAREAKREMARLTEDHPEWRTIVGAVDITKQQPDPANPYRRWLGTKDAAYQKRLNASESASEIGRSIALFQSETKARPAPDARPGADARAARIRDAVTPRGDNAGAAAGPSDQDEFEAGYASR